MLFFCITVGHIWTNRYQSIHFMCSVYVHGSKSSIKIKRTRVFARSLPWIFSSFSLGKCLGMNFFTSFFYVLSSYDGEKKLFHNTLLFFFCWFHFFPFFLNSWFLLDSQKKIFISYPSMIRCEPEKSWTLANENSLLSPTSSLVWVELFFSTVFFIMHALNTKIRWWKKYTKLKERL